MGAVADAAAGAARASKRRLDQRDRRRCGCRLDHRDAPEHLHCTAPPAVAPEDSPVLVAVFGVVGGLGMGLTVALVTGLFLLRLLDRARPDTAGEVGVRGAVGR